MVSTVNIGQGNKQGRAVVVIVDDLGNTVAWALVNGTFTGNYNESGSDTTDGTGTATITTRGTAKGKINFEFCVDSVTAALPYVPSSVTCASF